MNGGREQGTEVRSRDASLETRGSAANTPLSPFRIRVRRLARLRNAIDREHAFVPCSRLGPVPGLSLERNRMVTDAALLALGV